MHDMQDRSTPYEAITGRCFVNAPFARLQRDLLDLFLRHGLQPEIGLEGGWFWEIGQDEMQHVADRLQAAGLGCTLHAPFHDLVPGGFDPRMVALTRKKLQQAFALLPLFRPVSIVCHLGYEEIRHANDPERWLAVSLETWQPLLEQAAAHGVRVMFENTYEPGPAMPALLLERLHHAAAGFCLDVGHVLAFSRTPWQEWLERMAPWLGQLHLHDNDGEKDLHLAPGQGIFPFADLFQALKRQSIRPIVTLEPHREEDLLTSVETVRQPGMLPVLFS